MSLRSDFTDLLVRLFKSRAHTTVHDGIMVSLDLPMEYASQLVISTDELTAGTPSAVESLHLTLAYLGKVADAKFTQDDLVMWVGHFAANHGPLIGHIGGVARLYTDDPEGDVIIAYYDCPQLAQFRQDLVNSLPIQIAKNHGFIAHITLAYIPKDVDVPLPTLDLIEIPFVQVFVHFGDDVIPLTLNDSPERAIVQRAYHWDRVAGRYLNDAGEKIAAKYVNGLLRQSIEATGRNIEEMLKQGTSIKELRAVLRSEYIRQYLAGIGGVDNMTKADWGSLGAMLKNQYKYLPNLLAETQDCTEAQLANFSFMHANSAAEAFNRAKSKTAAEVGYDEVAWILDPTIQKHCETCLFRASLDYVPAGPRGGFMDGGKECWPGDGNTICLTNDGCSLSYRNSTTGEIYLDE